MMNMSEWLGSKKTKTALVAAVVPFVAYFLDIPSETAVMAVGGLIAAIAGFAHQDYAKARDSLSNSQMDVVGAAILKKLRNRDGISQPHLDMISAVIDEVKGS